MCLLLEHPNTVPNPPFGYAFRFNKQDPAIAVKSQGLKINFWAGVVIKHLSPCFVNSVYSCVFILIQPLHRQPKQRPHSRTEIWTWWLNDKSSPWSPCWSGRVSKYPWCINPLHFPDVFDESSTFTFQVSLIMNRLCCLPEVMARVKWNSFWCCPPNHRMWNAYSFEEHPRRLQV